MKSIFYAYLLSSFIVASSCDSETADPGTALADSGQDNDDTNDDQDTSLPEVSSDQEEEMCGDLSSTTGKFINAGAELGDGQVLSPSPGGFLLQLVEQGGDFGGYVEIAGGGQDVLFMLFKEDIPVTVLGSDGEEVSNIETNAGLGTCSEASGAYSWRMWSSPNYLEIGPTAAEEVRIALDKVE